MRIIVRILALIALVFGVGGLALGAMAGAQSEVFSFTIQSPVELVVITATPAIPANGTPPGNSNP